MENIEKTINYVNKIFNQSDYYKDRPLEKNYRLNHTFRVASIGKEIANREGLNEEAFIIGCLLHDISYIKEFNSKEDWLNHGRNAARMAREFLKTISIDDYLKEEIIYGIAIHVDDLADFEGDRTILAESIGEADNIDRFGKYRMYEALKNSDLDNLSLQEQIDFAKNRITSLNNLKLIQHKTKTSNNMWQNNLDDQINYYQALQKQLETSFETALMDK